ARGQLDESEIAALSDVGQDGVDRPLNRGVDGRGRPLELAHHGIGADGAGVEDADRHFTARAPVSARSSWISVVTAPYSVFIEARFTISRAVERMISSTSTSRLASSVLPDCTRSTMRSANPTSGASSIEPSRCTISTWMPFSEKYASVTRGYLVATRTHDHFEGSSRSNSSRGSATTRRQKPKPRSRGS